MPLDGNVEPIRQIYGVRLFEFFRVFGRLHDVEFNRVVVTLAVLLLLTTLTTLADARHDGGTGPYLSNAIEFAHPR